MIDVGQLGKFSDGGVFSNSTFGQAFEDGTLVLPEPAPLPGTVRPDLPFAMVGDEAFPLRNYLLRPYPGRHLPGNSIELAHAHVYLFTLLYLEDQAVYNYRLSRARRIIENTFGILVSR